MTCDAGRPIVRMNVVGAARAFSAHPRDLVPAINDGSLDAIRVRWGEVFVDADDIGPGIYRRLTLVEWAEANDTYYKAVRRMLAAGRLDGVVDGSRRRWILESD